MILRWGLRGALRLPHPIQKGAATRGMVRIGRLFRLHVLSGYGYGRPAQQAATTSVTVRGMPAPDAKDIAKLVRARMSELEPLVAEYNDLIEVDRTLTRIVDARAPERPARRSRTSGTRRAKDGPASKRLYPTLEQATDGLTAQQLADQLGLSNPSSVYKMLNDLRAAGKVRKDGRVWHVATAATMSEAAAPAAAPEDPAGVDGDAPEPAVMTGGAADAADEEGAVVVETGSQGAAQSAGNDRAPTAKTRRTRARKRPAPAAKSRARAGRSSGASSASA